MTDTSSQFPPAGTCRILLEMPSTSVRNCVILGLSVGTRMTLGVQARKLFLWTTFPSEK